MRNITSSLNEKLESSQQTPSNNSNPKMSIKVSRARTTVMDSDYWMVETIKEKPDLGDIALALKRVNSYSAPDRIYEIYVDEGTVKTALREYPDYLKDGWQAQFELGAGSSVSIAFDGHWQYNRGKWRIITDENPHIFWVDSSNILMTRLWDEQVTLQQLADSVVKVRSIRGWKNVNFADKDQGIIAAYIKTDGKVYYRNFCIQHDATKVWEFEKQLIEFTGVAININLFITNDYRVGFVVEDSDNKIYWYITKRNWAGMAIVPDKFYVESNINLSLIKTNRIYGSHDEKFVINQSMGINLLYSSSYNKFINTINIDDGDSNYGLIISANTSYELFDIQTNDFEVFDEFNTHFMINSITKIDAKNYSFLVDDFNSAFGSITLMCNGATTKNEGGYLFDTFNIAFVPNGLVPPIIPIPEVLEVYNE